MFYESKYLRLWLENNPVYGPFLELRIWRFSLRLAYHKPIDAETLGGMIEEVEGYKDD